MKEDSRKGWKEEREEEKKGEIKKRLESKEIQRTHLVETNILGYIVKSGRDL
jgi:hypothetical protein